MAVGGWELALVAANWLVLLASAGAIGGAYVLALARYFQFAALTPLHAYLQKCAASGLLANILWLLLQVGAVNRNGVGGMLDRELAAIFLQSGVGDAWQTRMLGFIVLLLFTVKQSVATLPPWAQSVLHACAAVLLLAAFGATGHVSTLGAFARIALLLHVLAVFLWIGALYPLLQLSRDEDLVKLQLLMRSFGQQAIGVVVVLLLAGLYLATQLLQAPLELLTTSYGRVLLLKIFGAYALLMLAATNKLLLVPRLASGGSAAALQKSIRMEWIVALLVLAVTSWMTTVVGPATM